MIYRSEKGNIRMMLAGDAMPARRLMPFDEPDFLALAELFRGADVSFANLETTVREAHEGTPIVTQGTPMSTPPALLDELKWLGISLMSTQVRLHPLDLGAGLSRAQLGRPVLARRAVAEAILKRVCRLSARHGTGMVIDGETALVRFDRW